MHSQPPILLVEANPDDELLTRRAFDKNGIANPVVVASDGETASRMMYGPDAITPVLILLDLKLPKLGGYDLLKTIRSTECTRHIPVIALTASTEDRDVLQSYGLTADSHLRKPVEFDEFHRVIGQVGLYWLLTNTRSPEPDPLPLNAPLRQAHP